MLKVLLIDESGCKKELAAFVKKQHKHVKMLEGSKELVQRVNKLVEQTEHLKNTPLKKLAVNTAECLTLLNVNDIIRCESNRNYTSIYLSDKKKLVASKTLMDFEDVLGKYHFLRIHKSHLINVNFMDKYIKSDGGYVVLTDGTQLPVAIRKKEYLFREIEKL